MHDSDTWKRELLEAGWKPYKKMHTTWQAPDGRLYIGPRQAWKVMTRELERERERNAGFGG